MPLMPPISLKSFADATASERSPCRLAGAGAVARNAALLGALAVLACGLSSAPAWAMYKVVNPDGSVTYTDRPPTTGNAKITPLGRRGTPGAEAATDAEAALPAELRQAMRRHPVTLYTSPDCAPCDNARQYLQRRGVPYAERRAVTEDDAAALERLVGGRTVPSLTIGAQPLRGFGEADWAVYLDAAGYPRESRLPRGWTAAAPRPLVERAQASERPAAAPAAPPPPPEPAEAEPAPTPAPAVRF